MAARSAMSAAAKMRQFRTLPGGPHPGIRDHAYSRVGAGERQTNLPPVATAKPVVGLHSPGSGYQRMGHRRQLRGLYFLLLRMPVGSKRVFIPRQTATRKKVATPSRTNSPALPSGPTTSRHVVMRWKPPAARIERHLKPNPSTASTRAATTPIANDQGGPMRKESEEHGAMSRAVAWPY